jgi:PAS domain S-box-containing protein
MLHPSHDKNWMTQVVREALSSGSNTELLKALVEAFPGSWFFTRLDGTFAFVNQRACDELGYSRDELMALTLFDINHELTRASWNALADVGPFVPASIRTVHLRKDGSAMPVEVFGARIILGDEDVAVSYAIDISENARTREDLAEKKHLLRSLLEQAPVIIWMVDVEGRLQLTEGSVHAVSGLLPTVPEIEQAAQRALTGVPVEGTITVGSAEFEYRYVPRRDDDGTIVGATGVAMDVTVRRAVEMANRRLTTAIEQSEEFVVLLSSAGVIEYANPAFEKISNTTRASAFGVPWTRLIPQGAEEDEILAELNRAITEGRAWRGTIHGRRPHRSDCIEQVSLSPLRDVNGRLTGFVAVGRDIAEQVRTQERLRQVEKMDAIGQLAGGIAHDFNNLLQVILGNVNLCLLRNPPDQFRSMLSEVEQASRRASSLVGQLLTFSRKGAGTQAHLSLDYLVNRLMPLIQRILGEHIQVELAIENGPFAICGEESQLEQVVLNLCINARDAMPEGGHLLLRLSRVELDSGEALRQSLSGAGSYIVFDVIDTGCGMTEEVQRRIFEPFFTTKGAGSGIGLATVYAVAKRHGGSVEVRSEVGVGSHFRVTFQCADPMTKPRQRSLSPPGFARKGRILLVEDDRSVRAVLRAFLEQDGHHVVVARDGQDATAILEKGDAAFDLMVLDAIMPQTSGPEVYRRFRSRSAAPVLLITGHAFNALDTLPKDPARALLEKPFSSLELAAVVQQLLADAALRQNFQSTPGQPMT